MEILKMPRWKPQVDYSKWGGLCYRPQMLSDSILSLWVGGSRVCLYIPKVFT